MAELITLPTDPNPAVDIVLKKISGEDVCLGELAHAGVHLAGYVVGKIHSCPDDQHQPVQCSGDLKTELQKLKTFGAGPGDASAIPWKPLLSMLLQALAQWLATN